MISDLYTAASIHTVDCAEAARRVGERFMSSGRWQPGYQTDLCLEGLLCLHEHFGDRRYFDFVDRVLQQRGVRPQDSLNWKILFTDLHSAMWMRTRRLSYVEGWLDDLYYYESALPRDRAGRILFFIEPEKPRLLIDMLQGYCLRLARAGVLTGDVRYFDRSAEQYALYADVLINPGNGLWHHGQGWIPGHPKALSPEGWCRGQAWVLRGLVESLRCMPATSMAHRHVHALLNQFADTLFRWQGHSGMWHQVVQAPHRSFPETSGTGMIVYYLTEALRMGLLADHDGARLRSLQRAQAALLEFVDHDGHVSNGCADGPPLPSLAHYLMVQPITDDPHAIAGVMMALSASLTPARRGDSILVH